MNKECECDVCKKKLDFNVPKEIINALIEGNLVLFAGAGISTEAKYIFRETFYENIRADLELPDDDFPTFPELMTRYCESTTNGRQKLLERIKFRFDYCKQFDELYRAASKFHSEISPLWMLNNIITTNWADYFESKCGAIPMVTAEDFAFFNISQRKVFKIHGSISNYGSIIASIDDYEKCYKELNEGLIGANLKTILATKVVIFVGYSFRDFDFMRIMDFMKREMKSVLPHIYIVTLDDTMFSRIRDIKSTIIKTDGTHFFSVIKNHLVNQGHLIPQKSLDIIYVIEYLRSEIHRETADQFYKNKTPKLLYCLMYQDGVQHAIDYLRFKMTTGEAYNPKHLKKAIHSYHSHLRKDYLKNKNYYEVSYIDGYIEGLLAPLTLEDASDFPFFYLFGIGSTSDAAFFNEAVEKDIVYHKSSERFAVKMFSDLLNSKNDVVPHHLPYF